MSTSDVILAFDLYGTLLSTSSIAAKLTAYVSKESADDIAARWRRYQLEYTWRLNSMQQYESFWTVTYRSLCQTLSETGVTLSTDQIDQVMLAYDELHAFEDVGPALEALKHEQGITAVVFSNGTMNMIQKSVCKSRGLAPYMSVFEELICVEQIERFKPDPQVYTMLAAKMGNATDTTFMGKMWLISANPFDVIGARAVGMRAIWVDRLENGWTDSLIAGDKGRPTLIVRDLGEVVEAVRRHTLE